MSRLILLGAGASIGASCVNPRNPPLDGVGLDQLWGDRAFDHSMLNSPSGYEVKVFLNKLTNRIKLELGTIDFEEFFGAIWLSFLYAFNTNPESPFSTNWNQLLNDLTNSPHKADRYLYIYLNELSQSEKINFLAHPINLLPLIQSILFMDSITWFSSYTCQYLAKIFSALTVEDTIASFNYDQLETYTLHNCGKLGPESFSYYPFKEIAIEPNSTSLPTLLFPHGSFCLFTDDFNHLFSSTVSVKVTQSTTGSAHRPYSIVLPLKRKKEAYAIPLYKTTMHTFIERLSRADEIWLLGKQFKTADLDLAEEIRALCSIGNTKKLYVANPEINNEEWMHYHLKLFNAEKALIAPTMEEFSLALKGPHCKNL